MHDIVRDNLEDYLRCSDGPRVASEVRQHLSACAECREAVQSMRDTSKLLESLRPPAGLEPSAGFYARVMARIEAERKPSVWNFLLDPVFGKRLMYASVTLVLLLGTFLVTTEPNSPEFASAPEVILSNQDRAPALSANTERDRDVLLVNLATYKD